MGFLRQPAVFGAICSLRNVPFLSFLFLLTSIVSYPPRPVHQVAPAVLGMVPLVGVSRLRGGSLIDEKENKMEEFIENLKLPPPEPQAPAFGPLHLTWSMAAPEAEDWRRSLLRQMDKPEKEREGEEDDDDDEDEEIDDEYGGQYSKYQEKWGGRRAKDQLFKVPSRSKEQQEPLEAREQVLSSSSAEIFRRFMLGMDRGGRKDGSSTKADAGVNILGRGIARELREERRNRHLKLIEADERSRGMKKQEEPVEQEGPAPPNEEELLEQWHGPAALKNSPDTDNTSLPCSPAEEEELTRKSESTLRAAIELSPGSAETWYRLGILLERDKNDKEEAEKSYGEALRIDKDHLEAAMSLARCLHLRGLYGDAENLYRHVLSRDQHHIDALCNFAALLHDVKRNSTEAAKLLQTALASSPDHAPSLCSLASVLHSLGSSKQQVEALFLRAMQNTNCSAQTYFAYASWLQNTEGEAGVIAELYGKALQEDPSHLPSLRAAGRLLGGAGLGRNATLLYEKAVQLEPRHLPTRYNFACVLQRTCNYYLEKLEGGRMSRRRIEQVEVGGRKAPVLDMYEEFLTEEEQKQHMQELRSSAIKEYEAILKMAPHHPPSLCNLALLYTQEEAGKDKDEIERLLLLAAEIVSNDKTRMPGITRDFRADVWCAYGAFLEEERGNQAAASRAYAEALQADRNHLCTLMRYANMAATVQKDYKVGECLYRHLIALVPEECDIWLSYADCLQSLEDYPDAEQAFKRALQLHPSNSAAIASYAAFLQGIKRDLPGAELLYKAALQISPGNALVLSNYAMLVEEFRGDYITAVDLYRRALAADPEDKIVLIHLSLLLSDINGDPKEAEGYLRRALQVDPTYLPAISNMASFQYAVMQDKDAAEKLFRKALKLYPHDVGTLVNYGCLLEEGRRDRYGAEKLYSLARSIDPSEAERCMEQSVREPPQIEDLSDD